MAGRRVFLIAGSAGMWLLACCRASFAQQQGKVWQVGLLSPFPSGNDQRWGVFKQQLRDLGHIEGKTITIEHVSADGNYDRLPALAADLVRRNVDVIVARGTPAATAARNATRTIPVVIVGVADPVGQGLVASLARPGGNVTGVSDQHPEFAVKLLELFNEAVPSAKRIAILSNPTNSSLPKVIQEIQAAARVLRLETVIVNARAPAELEKAFAEITRDRPGGLFILSDSVLNNESARLAKLALTHQLPTVGGSNVVPERGGLMSYGPNRLDNIRRAAVLVDKILKGAKTADLPVEQPRKFELILNMKTAKALGITIPQSVLVRADRVIE